MQLQIRNAEQSLGILAIPKKQNNPIDRGLSRKRMLGLKSGLLVMEEWTEESKGPYLYYIN